MHRSATALLSFSMLTLGLPQGRANFGTYPGGWNSEPPGLKYIRIVRETLTVDLRGCDGSEVTRGPETHKPQPVGKVEAVYNLYNEGSEQQINLLFAAGVISIANDAIQVFMNDQPVQTTPTDAHNPDWRGPGKTPAIEDWYGSHPFFRSMFETNFRVSLKVPAGSSTLRVQFRTTVGKDGYLYPTCCWQFIYLLAPARDWGGFDKLEIKVLIPSGWNAACNLDLARDGEVLTGTFDGIPSDALALTIRMPPEPVRERMAQVRLGAWIGLIATVALLLLVTWFCGSRIQRRVGKTRLVLASAWRGE